MRGDPTNGPNYGPHSGTEERAEKKVLALDTVYYSIWVQHQSRHEKSLWVR